MFSSLLASGQISKDTLHPEVVKALLPASSFRRSGPGVMQELMRALSAMTEGQRNIAKAKGWDRGLL